MAGGHEAAWHYGLFDSGVLRQFSRIFRHGGGTRAQVAENRLHGSPQRVGTRQPPHRRTGSGMGRQRKKGGGGHRYGSRASAARSCRLRRGIGWRSTRGANTNQRAATAGPELPSGGSGGQLAKVELPFSDRPAIGADRFERAIRRRGQAALDPL